MHVSRSGITALAGTRGRRSIRRQAWSLAVAGAVFLLLPNPAHAAGDLDKPAGVGPTPPPCPTEVPVVTFSPNNSVVGTATRFIASGRGWVRGGEIKINLGNEQSFVIHGKARVGPEGTWKIKMATGEETLPSEYVIFFSEDVPGCSLEAYQTFHVVPLPAP